jgi:hypothetical protein
MAELPLLNCSSSSSSASSSSSSSSPSPATANVTFVVTSGTKRTFRLWPDHLRHAWYAVLFLVVGQVIVCNLILIRAAIQRRCYGPPSYTNYFIVSMATADLIVGTLVMPFGVVSLMCGTWMFSRLWCDLWQTFDFFACTVSIFNLCAISIDRYSAVTAPFAHQRWIRSRAPLSAVLILWLLAAMITFPPLIVRLLWFAGDPSTGCSNMYTQRAYVLFSSATTFFLPLMSMSVVNWRIHRIARHKTTRPSFKSLALSPLPSFSSSSTGDPLTNRTNYYKQPPQSGRPRRHLALRANSSRLFAGQAKATQTLMIVTGVFVICWLPYYTLVSLLAIWPRLPVPTSKVIPVTLWLGWCNSAINPIIYTCLSRTFRAVLLQNLGCCCNNSQTNSRAEARDNGRFIGDVCTTTAHDSIEV